MDKIGWKVVTEADDGPLTSAIGHCSWTRQYVVGRRTVGFADTPVLAFRTRQAARKFVAYSHHRVFKALLENPRQQGRVATPWQHTLFEGFWGGSLVGTRPAPDGTLACDAITLLEPA